MTASTVPEKGASQEQINAHIAYLLGEMSLDEKVYMMSGHGFFAQYLAGNKVWAADPYQAGGGCERLGVPAFFFTDGPRGVARGQSTCFPVTMARGASFDPDLERRVGAVMAIEARAQGCNLSGAVCINLLRHPAWGRAQETYGEDSYHLGEMGAALALGLQSHNVAATVKHFALNSIENTRFKVDVRIDERSLHEIYLPHFKRVIDTGIASVMSAYNKLNGEYCGQNRHLLTGILRDLWGFDGFVHSDWIMGVYQVYGAAAGLDVENPEPRVFGQALVDALKAGQVEPQVVDRACERILRTIYRFACAHDPYEKYEIEQVACADHTRLALEVARKSMVLLKNDQLLPLAPARLRKIALIGRMADSANLGDRGSSLVRPPYVVTPLAGIRQALGPDVDIIIADENDLAAVRAIAAQADAVIILAGLTPESEGEFIPGDLTLDGGSPSGRKNSIGGDRSDLYLPADQEAMIKAACAVNENCVVVITAGSAIMMEHWQDQASAILFSFYAGMEGGAALADILFGKVSPSGKLPFTIPKSIDDLPVFDRNALTVTYDYWHGYSKLDRDDKIPAYAFGFGLSYARIQYRALNVRRHGAAVKINVTLRNDGDMAVDEITQIYIGAPGKAAPRPIKSLKAFQRVTLVPGQTSVLEFTIPFDQLGWWNPATRRFEFEPGTYTIYAGGSSRVQDLISVKITL
jgi:beta-glucosidase